MATLRQKRIAKMIVENTQLEKPLNAGEMLEKVRYGKISKQPARVIKSKGVKEELEKLGFNEYSAKKVVQEIMLDKKTGPVARLKATDQIFKVFGTYTSEKLDVHTTGSVIYLPSKGKQ